MMSFGCFLQTTAITNREVRRCFVNSKLPNTQKKITELALAPLDYSLLVVGAVGGLIEVLRPDSILTCLHQFSVLNPTLSTADSAVSYHLTGVCLVPRPNWLTGSQPITDLSDNRSTQSAGRPSDPDNALAHKGPCDIEPFKRHFGWLLDDVVRLRLPAINELTDTRVEMADIYLDDFHSAHVGEIHEPPHSETKNLLEQIDKLNSTNRELFHQLMNRELLG
ncbi:unnamed protein product [Echinostoma caproni]|uniref:Uncharacterized protein n=1 Tax=Echinostoma caproni TaxID=27848 RepID=A0A183AZ38_9TREM|nr:unnamed protein product [Echinostoma caproni]